MAIPATPSNLTVQQANQQVLATCSLTPGALTYDFQRSTDQITYASVAVTAIPQYLDTAVTLGTQYWYKVSATNVDGTSPLSQAQSTIPTPNGEMSLAQIRLNSQQRADRVNSPFVTLPEWNSYINQSLFELYDLLVTAYGEEYFAAPFLVFNTNGTDQFYPLPDGTNYNGAPPFYKMLGLDLGLNTNAQPNNGWVTVKKFNFIDRNAFYYPNTNSSQYGVFNLRYRLFGNKLEFIPTPNSGQPMRLIYIPRMTQLLKDTDITSSGISGWIEYIIVDAAIKALQKEESDVSVLQSQKMALIKRIEAAGMNRDAGQADTVSDTRSTNGSYGGYGPGQGFGAGW